MTKLVPESTLWAPSEAPVELTSLGVPREGRGLESSGGRWRFSFSVGAWEGGRRDCWAWKKEAGTVGVPAFLVGDTGEGERGGEILGEGVWDE